MATKNITIRVSEQTADFISSNFENPTQGATICVETIQQMLKTGIQVQDMAINLQFLQQIRAYSKREIKGVLTANEWKYLADALNGTLITPEFRCNAGGLIASIEDSNDFDNLGVKWNVDIPGFIEKIRKLTGSQIDCIYFNI